MLLNNFIISATQIWERENEDYRQGLFYRTDGTLPGEGADPMIYGVLDSEGKEFGKLYRDLEDNSIIYTWYSGNGENTIGLWKIDFNTSSFTISEDFDETNYDLLGIDSFFQYANGNTRHQYILAKTDNTVNGVEWNIWHRDDGGGGSLSASGWDIIVTLPGRISGLLLKL